MAWQEGREVAPGPCPAAVPQASLRALRATNHFVGKRRVDRAEAVRRLLEAHGGVPPVQHDCSSRQRLALQAPAPNTEP
jgi:hypothetical protein